MDQATIHRLNQLTTEFYARCSDSFSATRSAAWNGWERVLADVAPVFALPECSVLDLGCGNLRFEDFLARYMPSELCIWTIDACEELVPARDDLRFLKLDIVSRLSDQTISDATADVPRCDLVCAFGLFHHVPDPQLRRRLLEYMSDKTAPGGFIALSLWQLEKDERLRAKALNATQRAMKAFPALQLEAHDWLLGWQDDEDALRYCHSFDEVEIEDLVQGLSGKAQLVDRFCADGKSGDLNQYLVFEARA